jgi:hypothetical protein
MTDQGLHVIGSRIAGVVGFVVLALPLMLLPAEPVLAQQAAIDPFAMQLLHSQVNEGFAEIQRRNYEAAKVRFAAAYARSQTHGALGSSALAGSAQATFALGDPLRAAEHASRAIQLAQFKSLDHLIVAFETRAHARAVFGNAIGAAGDYMSVVGLDPQQAPIRYGAALDRCKVPPGAELKARLEAGIARKCPLLDVASLSPQLLARWYPGFAQVLAAEQAEARRVAELARQAEERRRVEQARAGGDPSSVPYLRGSSEANVRANIGFCNKSRYEVRVAMVRRKGKFGGLFTGRTWIADGYYALAPSACTHRNFGYAEDFTEGYVSIFRKRGDRWVASSAAGTKEEVGGAAWVAHPRSICWPDSAEQADPDRECVATGKSLSFTHWFSTSGLVRRLRVDVFDDSLEVNTLTER